METNDEALKIIQRTLDEAGVEADEVLAALVEVLVRDHVAVRAKAGVRAGVINHPTTLWTVEKLIAEQLHGPAVSKPAVGKPAVGKPAVGGPIDPRLGSLAVLLVTCRERAEDLAEGQQHGSSNNGKTPDNELPTMRLVRD